MGAGSAGGGGGSSGSSPASAPSSPPRVATTFTLEGNIADYSDNVTQAAMAQTFATAANVSVSAVQITITPASVNVNVEIEVASTAAATSISGVLSSGILENTTALQIAFEANGLAVSVGRISARPAPAAPLEDGPRRGSMGRQTPVALVPVADMNLTIHNLRILRITRLEFDTFSVKLKYNVEWSSRYATHPCQVNLYADGQGVGARGKFIPAKDWWTPKPKGLDAEKTDVKSKANLQVMHAPQMPVREVCTPQTCPWPKQLYLKDSITATVTFASTWDLGTFPFDEQILTGTLVLVDNVAFPADRFRIHLAFTQPLEDYNPTGEALKDLFPGTAWLPLSASLSPHHVDKNHLAVDFRIKVQRSAKGPIFKVLLPVICNALFAILASRMGPGPRMKLLALSMIAATSMLQPSRLGLPAGVEGVPFVMALVISHMGIVGAMLLVTVYMLEIGHKADKAGDKLRKAKRAAFTNHWKPFYDKKHELEQEMGMDTAEPPKELSKHTFWDHHRGAGVRLRVASSKAGASIVAIASAAKAKAPTPPRPSILLSKFAKVGAQPMPLESSTTASSTEGPSSNAPADASPQCDDVTTLDPPLSPLKRVAPEAPEPPDAPGSPPPQRDHLLILTKAMLVLPGLIHHAVQSTLPFPSHPEGFGKSSYKADWMTPTERALGVRNTKINEFLHWAVPPTYLFVWIVLFFAYFTGPSQ